MKWIPRRLNGEPRYGTGSQLARLAYLARYGRLGDYIWRSRCVAGWTHGAEAVALARVAFSLPDHAVIVEIGSFLGCSAILLAGARKLRGSGRVHCVDTFDCAGDSFSRPIYEAHQRTASLSLRERFQRNLGNAGLEEWVNIHQMRQDAVARQWRGGIDLLFMDGDHSVAGARQTYECWLPHLEHGAWIAIHNSRAGVFYQPDHDGSMRLVADCIRGPGWEDVQCIDGTTFARRGAS